MVRFVCGYFIFSISVVFLELSERHSNYSKVILINIQSIDYYKIYKP